LGDDELKTLVDEAIDALPDSEKPFWYQLVRLANRGTGAKPSARFLADTKKIIDELGADRFKKTVVEWFNFIIKFKEKEKTHTYTIRGREYRYSEYEFFDAANLDAMKGFVWMCAAISDNSIIHLIVSLAERCYRKIPQKGPVAAGLGNACFNALAMSENMEGIGQLSRLKLRIKHSSAQSLIEKYLLEAAKEKNVSIYEIEDLSADDFGLSDGKKEMMFDDYRAVLTVTAIGKTEIKWFKPDGTPQKTIPAFVAAKYAAELKMLKEDAKNIEKMVSTHRDRIDRMFRAERKMNYKHFERYYLNHGLVSYIARNLVWNFTDRNGTLSAVYRKNLWIDREGIPVEIPEDATVSLWHPATESVENVKAWRSLITTIELRQPDANLKAQFWVCAVEADNAFNDTGIWNYVSADQIRFAELGNDKATVDLINVPVVPFSEVLRDVDLFVGVASVGNDPQWMDSGGTLPAYRDYWQTYSFGELSEVAKTRREILEKIVPRLKIGKVAEIKDKFLTVKGKLRTYKIHIGSANVLMEPNNQYLCIVPDRREKDYTQNVFLPFEGDSGLSIILSKAFLLAEDDKITDTTITSQIRRF
jgi:hypothetical protein